MLDDREELPPRHHYGIESRLAWFETTDALPRFDERGPDIG